MPPEAQGFSGGRWLFSQIGEVRVWPAHVAGTGKPVLHDPFQGLDRLAFFIAEIKEEAVAVNDFPPIVQFFDLEPVRVEFYAVFACH